MAKASTTEIVITPPVEPVVERRVVLELTFEEANVLAMVLGAISGSSSGSRRFTDEIWRTLRHEVGVTYDYGLAAKMDGATHFLDS